MKVEHIGDATLYLDDCMNILPTLKRVDAVVTDPPYRMEMVGGGLAKKLKYIREISGFTDGGFDMSILNQFENWTVFCSIGQLPELIELAKKHRWMLITWNKPNPCPLVNGNYLPDTEYIVHSFPSGGLHGNYADRSRFIVYPAQQHISHPNEKPLCIIEKCVRCASAPSETILDPFMGSGTTGIACMNLGRKFVGIEIEPKYFDIACKRIELAYQQPRLFEEERSEYRQKTLEEGSEGGGL